ncbi:outer-membrane lipoprotein carrier protein [Oxobacter pfennigii]|uniref:Outer-membrane lipoprotein carrier protein n=1 Tax=Oxobacter pfennigii TaxID=36849 RepID=A0A0P8WYE4_9CLOT|nr:outer-membrane lipoprotein carrier protein LolA [Oxobacter pfennigii]KPU43405.1 outer-membrane lipoprotein carrier protein [Oxobacter pfennigii]
MKKFRLYILIILIIILAQGCSKPGEDDFSKAHKMLSGLESYTTTAEIIIRGNKLVGSYIVKQHFKYPDRYRLETVSPDDKRGKITIYDGYGIWIYNPQINQTYTMENFKEVEESGMFPGYFAKNLFSGEEAVYDIMRDGEAEYITIKVLIPGTNPYRKHQILYIDKEKMIPVKMEVLDSSGNTTITVYYRDFKYNEELDEDIFKRMVAESL